MHRATRFALFGLAAVLLLTVWMLPVQWYQQLPLDTAVQQFPVSGFTLLQAALLLEAALLLVLAATGWRYQPNHSRQALLGESPDTHQPPAWRWLLAVTALAALLRLYALPQSLWIDEIATLQYTTTDLFSQLALFVSPNDHLLNTLLMKLSIALFGESEWSVRLPAVLFGIATVPLFYLLTQRWLGNAVAIAASLLLAVSYHHIFFSQNARGYAAHLFLSLAATGYLMQGLKHDRMRDWLLYIVVMLLNFVALMNSVFVLLSHVLVSSGVLFVCWRKQCNWQALLRRLFFVFSILGLLVFHFYSVKIPQIVVTLSQMYANQATGFSPFSYEFLQELMRGIGAGFGGGVILAALPFLLVGLLGMLRFARQNLTLALLLLLPGVLTGLYLVLKGLTVSPRFFLFELFFVILCAVYGIEVVINALQQLLRWQTTGRQRAFVVTVLLLAALSLASLQHYYQTPKQAYREATRYLEQAKTEGARILVISTAGTGIAYYHGENQYADNTDFMYSRELPQLVELLSTDSPDTLAVTTFHRALRLTLPEVITLLQQRWQPVRHFPATIGDGAITIWQQKPVNTNDRQR